ncbi:MAG: hypothetical protein JEZ12_16155 [Desulfobacterium sp.]|nr:hypothetical protein [Desulfobacterium sp.]
MITSAQGNDFRPPQKLDHFRLTTTERDENGDLIIDKDLQDKIIENGNCLVNGDGNLTGIPIRLLYDDTDQNFPTQYACYASGKLICRGDGEESYKRIDDFKKAHTCPCNRVSQDFEGKDKCKPTGKLTCIIDEAGLFGQAHTFRTTSMNSVRGLLGGIDFIKAATKGRLAGLPLMLTMNAKQTATPSGAPTTIFIVSLCYRGSMSDLRQEVLTMLSQEKQYLIGMDTIAPEHATVGIQPGSEEEQEFVEEFFPDAVVMESTNASKMEDHVNVITEPEQEKGQEKTDSENSEGNQVPNNQTGTNSKKDDLTPHDGDNDGPRKCCSLKDRLLKEGGNYAVLYNRFIVLLQDDKRDEAAKMAKRMTKEFLVIWFEREQPQVKLDPKIKKPELLEKIIALLAGEGPVLSYEKPVIEPTPTVKADQGQDQDDDEMTKALHPLLVSLAKMTDQKEVADAVAELFHPIPINKTLDIPGLIALAQRKIESKEPAEEKPVQEQLGKQPPVEKTESTETPESEPESNEEKFPREWDAESGPVQKDQLRYLVQLKNNLERQGLLKAIPQAWLVCVNYFFGADGQPLDTATKLTHKQCETFIVMLELQLEKQEDLIPF